MLLFTSIAPQNWAPPLVFRTAELHAHEHQNSNAKVIPLLASSSKCWFLTLQFVLHPSLCGNQDSNSKTWSRALSVDLSSHGRIGQGGLVTQLPGKYLFITNFDWICSLTLEFEFLAWENHVVSPNFVHLGIRCRIRLNFGFEIEFEVGSGVDVSPFLDLEFYFETASEWCLKESWVTLALIFLVTLASIVSQISHLVFNLWLRKQSAWLSRLCSGQDLESVVQAHIWTIMFELYGDL